MKMVPSTEDSAIAAGNKGPGRNKQNSLKRNSLNGKQGMEQLECELEEAKAQIAAQRQELDSLRAELQRKEEEAGSWQIKSLTLENESTSMRSTIQDLTYTRDAKDKALMEMGERMYEMEERILQMEADMEVMANGTQTILQAREEDVEQLTKAMEKEKARAEREARRAAEGHPPRSHRLVWLVTLATVPLAVLTGGLLVAATRKTPVPITVYAPPPAPARVRYRPKDGSSLGSWVPE